jgi:hypothetical protein
MFTHFVLSVRFAKIMPCYCSTRRRFIPVNFDGPCATLAVRSQSSSRECRMRTILIIIVIFCYTTSFYPLFPSVVSGICYESSYGIIHKAIYVDCFVARLLHLHSLMNRAMHSDIHNSSPRGTTVVNNSSDV